MNTYGRIVLFGINLLEPTYFFSQLSRGKLIVLIFFFRYEFFFKQILLLFYVEIYI